MVKSENIGRMIRFCCEMESYVLKKKNVFLVYRNVVSYLK